MICCRRKLREQVALRSADFCYCSSRAQSEEEATTSEVVEGADLGIVGDDTQVSSDGPLSPAAGVETVRVFPKNAGKRAMGIWAKGTIHTQPVPCKLDRSSQQHNSTT
ncbi:hypothetical protein ABZP36_011608 [Zizania latifolia]